MKTKKDCPPCRKTSIGGQALLEGVMMRGPQKTALAVRNTDGEIVLEDWNNETSKHSKVLKIPFVRGVFNLFDSFKLGYKCLMRSAEISGLEEAEAEIAREKEEKKRAKLEKKAAQNGSIIETVASEEAEVQNDFSDAEADTDSTVSAEAINDATDSSGSEKKGSSATTTTIMIISTLLGVALAVVLFIYVPTFLTTLLLGKNAATEHPIWLSVISGVIKVALLIGYMLLVTLMKDIRRTFMYHGAEHKTIFCYEHGKELTIENVKKERRFHPRCGTSFLFLMLFVSVIIMIPISLLLRLLPDAIKDIRMLYTLIRTGIAILMLPIMAGIGYELIKLAGRHDNVFTRIISAPGLWMQRITTKEPDDGMIECAIASLKAVIPPDESDKW